jgi:DNA polymerase III delta subunit
LRRSGTGFTVEEFPEREAASAKPFAFVEAIGRRDVAGALAAAQEQLRGGREPLELVGLIGWQLQRWVLVRRLLDAAARPEAIAAASGLRDWQLERVKAELRGRTTASVQRALRRCWQLDADAKRGKVPPLTALELLVMELCLEPAGLQAEAISPSRDG